MSDLSADLAAMRVRLHCQTFHIPADRSFDGESIRCDYCIPHGTVARLLARLEEMRVAMEGVASRLRHYTGEEQRHTGKWSMEQQTDVDRAIKIEAALRPLTAP